MGVTITRTKKAKHKKSKREMVLSPDDVLRQTFWSLDRKIEETVNRIIDWYVRHNGRVFVSVSGGLDSTVLLDLVRRVAGYPDVPGVFSNTGLEFQENKDFVRSLPNILEVRPKRSFTEVISRFGYPVVSKRVSQYIGEVQSAKGDTATKRLRMTGIKTNGEFTELGRIPPKWQPLVNADFKISDACCRILKKAPLRQAEKLYGAPFVGTRAEESNQRMLVYRQFGCNAYELKSPRSTPMAFWSHQDVLRYIKREKLSYSALYDMGYNRSGCMWCMLGAHNAGDRRFALLKKTHPKVWEFCRDRLGLFKVMDEVKRVRDMT